MKTEECLQSRGRCSVLYLIFPDGVIELIFSKVKVKASVLHLPNLLYWSFVIQSLLVLPDGDLTTVI